MRKLIPSMLAFAVIALYGAFGWHHLVADSALALPRAADASETQRPMPGRRFSFERGGRNCAMPSWRV